MVNIIYWKRLRTTIKVFGFPILKFTKNSLISVGKNLVLISAPYFSEPGVNHPVIIRTIASKAEISIGDNVGISGGSIISAKRIHIGNNVMLGANVVISDTDFHPTSPINRRFNHENVGEEAVFIDDNVFIGMNSTVLKGVKIGKNSIIGAGSIVTNDIPENCIAVGVPSKVIRRID